MAKHRIGKQRLRKCHGCGKDFTTKEMDTHITEIIKSLRV